MIYGHKNQQWSLKNPNEETSGPFPNILRAAFA